MTVKLPPLKDARILVTNDDGIHAPGIARLEAIAKRLSDDVWVCAPEVEQSGSSHSLTISRPLRIRKWEERRYAVDGTPTDCVLLAIRELLADHPPDLVLSGINMGGNMGDDVTYSGTIAATMESVLLGVPAMALSQHLNDRETIDWQVAEHFGEEVIRKIAGLSWPKNVLININFPQVAPEAVTGVEIVPAGKHKIGDNLEKRQDPRGRHYYWIGTLRGEQSYSDDSDIAVVSRGGISVTPLTIDLNHSETLAALRERFRVQESE